MALMQENPTFIVPVLEWRERHPIVEVFLGATPARLQRQLEHDAAEELKLAPVVAWLRHDLLTSASTTAILTLLSWALDMEAADEDPLPALQGSVVLQDPDQPGILAPVPLELRAEDTAIPEDVHILLGQDVLSYFSIQTLDDQRLACTLKHGTEGQLV